MTICGSRGGLGGTCPPLDHLNVTLNVSTGAPFLLHMQMHIAQTSTMKCSVEQCFFSYAARTYDAQHVSFFFFSVYTFLILFLFSDFTVFIVSDLNDVTSKTIKKKLFYNYTVTVNAYLNAYHGNTYNDIFKYYYTEHFSIIMLLFVMRTILLFYTPLLLFLLLLLLSMI